MEFQVTTLISCTLKYWFAEKAAELANGLPTDLDCRYEDEKCNLYFLISKNSDT